MKFGVHENVPDVWAAFDVNVPPAVMAVPDAVNVVMASPSGSLAVTVKVISVFSAPEAVAGAVTTGARSPFETVIAVVAEPVRAFVAVNVTLNVPVCVLDGVQLNVPDVNEAFAVNVAPVGSGAAVRDAMASPSGSAAVTVNVMRTLEEPLTVAGAVTTGARSVLVTVIAVAAVPVRAFVAVNVTLNVPVCALVGVQLNVPDVLPAPAVKVAPVGSGAAVSDVMASPSGSAAVTVNVMRTLEEPLTVAGAVTTGARSVFVTVIAVVAVPVMAFVAVKVTL